MAHLRRFLILLHGVFRYCKAPQDFGHYATIYSYGHCETLCHQGLVLQGVIGLAKGRGSLPVILLICENLKELDTDWHAVVPNQQPLLQLCFMEKTVRNNDLSSITKQPANASCLIQI
jgi:hypothetical protein